MKIQHSYLILIIISLGIFLCFLPIALSIQYQQNDDIFYYQIINNFLNGDFKLPEFSAPTFYSTGLLALIFTKLFGISRIPLLTLAVSITAVFIFALIIFQYFKKSLVDTLLFAGLLIVNPLFVFTMWGFMTDNYFLLYFLTSVYFLLMFEKRYFSNNEPPSKYKDFITWGLFALGNLFICISYFTRQFGMITGFAFGVWLIIKKRYFAGVLQLALFALLAIYHFAFFPKTGEMLESKLVFSNLTYLRHLYTETITILMYLVMFTIPLVIVFLTQNIKDKRNLKQNLYWIFMPLFLIVFQYLYFNPLGWINERFFYLKYTIHRKGFFVEHFKGIKPEFPLDGILYGLWDWVAKILLAFLISFFVLNIKKIKKYVNFFSIYLVVYIVLLNLSVKLYDRYLIPLIPIVVMFLISYIGGLSRRAKLLSGVFVIMLGFYSYNFSADYMMTNNYVWVKTNELLFTTKVPPDSIVASDSWDKLYGRSENISYKFTYDQADYKDSTGQNAFLLVDEKKIEYPLNIWKGNVIYLYKNINYNGN